MVVGIGVGWQAAQAQDPSLSPTSTQAHMKHTPPDRIDRPTYEALDALSFSGMKHLDVSPAAYAYWKENPQPRTPALTKGLLCHALLLEPQTVDSRYAFAPEDAPKKPTRIQREAKKPSPDTLAAIAFWDDFAKASEGKEILPAADLEEARSIVAAALHYLSKHNLEHIIDERESWIERPLSAKADAKTPVKCIPDIIDRDGLVWDFKTTSEDLDDDSIWSLVHKRKYAWQAAHYLGIARLHRPDIQGFRNLFVRSNGLLDASCVIIDGEPLDNAKKACARLYSLFDKCSAENRWPAFSDKPPRTLASMQRFPSNPQGKPLAIAGAAVASA